LKTFAVFARPTGSATGVYILTVIVAKRYCDGYQQRGMRQAGFVCKPCRNFSDSRDELRKPSISRKPLISKQEMMGFGKISQAIIAFFPRLSQLTGMHVGSPFLLPSSRPAQALRPLYFSL
jgi:hypothetical protein